MMDKTFEPASVEARINKAWEEADAFKAGRGAAPGAEPYCIVIPPPNVTGSLHMGHALNNTLQDMLVPLRAHARQATCCGSPAPTMPASRRRWWSSAS
jgi:valyl-tRNA synthetase